MFRGAIRSGDLGRFVGKLLIEQIQREVIGGAVTIRPEIAQPRVKGVVCRV